MSEPLSVSTRVSAAALVVANIGAGMFVGANPDVLNDQLGWAFGLVLIVLAAPAAVTATLGEHTRFLDEGVFASGVAWVLVTALFVQALPFTLAWVGLSLVLVAATIATFALWLGLSRQEAVGHVS